LHVSAGRRGCFGALFSKIPSLKWYLLMPIMLAFAVTLPAIIKGRFGWSKEENICWFIHVSSLETLLWQWGSWFLWMLVGTIYCFYVVVSVLMRVKRAKKRFDMALEQIAHGALPEMNSNTPAKGKRTSIFGYPSRLLPSYVATTAAGSVAVQSSAASSISPMVVARVLRFPVITLLTQSPTVLAESWSYIQYHALGNMPVFSKANSPWWFITAEILSSVQGVLIFMAFCFDPAVERAWEEVRTSSVEWYHQMSGNSMRKRLVKILFLRKGDGRKRMESTHSVDSQNNRSLYSLTEEKEMEESVEITVPPASLTKEGVL